MTAQLLFLQLMEHYGRAIADPSTGIDARVIRLRKGSVIADVYVRVIKSNLSLAQLKPHLDAATAALQNSTLAGSTVANLTVLRLLDRCTWPSGSPCVKQEQCRFDEMTGDAKCEAISSGIRLILMLDRSVIRRLLFQGPSLSTPSRESSGDLYSAL